MKRKRIKGKDRGGNRYLYMNAGILNERQLIVSLQVKKTDTLDNQRRFCIPGKIILVLTTLSSNTSESKTIFKWRRHLKKREGFIFLIIRPVGPFYKCSLNDCNYVSICAKDKKVL